MKLVAAKCPSCGATIDVDANSDSTKCEFCNSKILVDDAIQKLRIELSGKIEVSNLPNIEKLSINGNRYYSNYEYNNAFDQYSKLLEIDPNNVIALLRRGISGALMGGYEKHNVDLLTNGINDAFELVGKDDEETKRQIISEGFFAIKSMQQLITNHCDGCSLKYDELLSNRSNLFQIKMTYELLIENTNAGELKRNMILAYMNLIDYILNLKYYIVYNPKTGYPVRQSITISNTVLNQIYDDKNKYVFEYNTIVDSKDKIDLFEPENKRKLSSFALGVIILSIIIFVGFLIGIGFAS